jgi:hypothetical protein
MGWKLVEAAQEARLPDAIDWIFDGVAGRDGKIGMDTYPPAPGGALIQPGPGVAEGGEQRVDDGIGGDAYVVASSVEEGNSQGELRNSPGVRGWSVTPGF